MLLIIKFSSDKNIVALIRMSFIALISSDPLSPTLGFFPGSYTVVVDGIEGGEQPRKRRVTRSR